MPAPPAALPSVPSPTTRWLSSSGDLVLSAWAIVAAFSTYFCMYAFRKPFAVATFPGAADLPFLPPLDLKILFILSQVAGYCVSKFLGIKVVSEVTPGRRALAILGCIGIAEVALLLFALVPPPWNAVCLVLNGLPLGMVWGLVFGFLEGRRVTDLLGAALCGSFIVASGFVKTVGKWLLGLGISEYWMPGLTGALFVPPLLLSVWMLARLPAPTAEDERLRVKRVPMDARARRAFVAAHAPGLVLLTAAYVLLTAYRDFRDNFARELWDALGYSESPAILTTAEIPVAFGSLLAVAWMFRIRSNRRALAAIHAVMVGGAVLVGASTLAFQAGLIGPAPWMVSVGLGLYLGYVPYNCVLFDRLIAAVGSAATAGFLITFADAFGYLGSSALLLYKNFGQADLPWLPFFTASSYVTAAGCAVLLVASGLWFHRRTPDAGAAAGAARRAG